MKLSLYAVKGDEEKLVGTVEDHPLRGDAKALQLVQDYPADLTLRQIATLINQHSRYVYALWEEQASAGEETGDRIVVKHLPGQHDQAEHGNWAEGAEVFARLETVREVDYGRGHDMPVSAAEYERAYVRDYGAANNSLKAYKAAGPEFQAMQRELRTAKQPTPEIENHVKAIDQAIEKTTLAKDTVLYRGMNWTRGAPPDAQNLAGRTFGDQGFTSASLDRRRAGEYAAKLDPAQRAMVVIHCKAGQHAVAMDQFGADEDEFLLPRGTWYRVIRDSYDPQARDPHRQRVLEVEIVQ